MLDWIGPYTVVPEPKFILSLATTANFASDGIAKVSCTLRVIVEDDSVPTDNIFTSVDPTTGGVIVNEYVPKISPSLLKNE